MPTPEEIYNLSQERNNIDTTITKHMVYPVASSECVKPVKETWDSIWLSYMESEEYAACSQEELFSTYSKWLEANYKAPVRK